MNYPEFELINGEGALEDSLFVVCKGGCGLLVGDIVRQPDVYAWLEDEKDRAAWDMPYHRDGAWNIIAVAC